MIKLTKLINEMRYEKTLLTENIHKIYYHATLSSNIPSIDTNGLKIGIKTNKHVHGFDIKNKIFVSTSYDEAFYYGSLFANKKPISIIILKLPDSYVKPGYTKTEFIVNQNIDPIFIEGVYQNKKIIDLSLVDINKNYINYDMLKGADLKVALEDYNND